MSRDRTNGFVLISTIWMLVLGGGIAAALTLRSVDASRSVAVQSQHVRETLALRSAIEVVVGDVLVQGPRSPWWTLPSSRSLQLDGVDLTVSATSEAARVDLNIADVRVIDDYLRARGWPSTDRATLIRVVTERRRTSMAIRSFDELGALVTRPLSRCLAVDVTLYSGLGAPPENAEASSWGEIPVRLEVRTASGRTLSTIVRPALPRRPYDTLEWRPAGFCDLSQSLGIAG